MMADTIRKQTGITAWNYVGAGGDRYH